MTELRVTQGGAEALVRALPGARVSQVGIEYLHRVGTRTRVTQVGAEYLHRVEPSLSISQVGAEVLHKHVPCTTQWAQIWKITRADGATVRLTSLDRNLVWKGETYLACDSLAPSSSEGVSAADAAGTMDLSGAIGGSISELHLFAGLYDGAYVEAWLVPWSGTGTGRLLLRGTFGPVEHGDRGFRVELLGDGARLKQTPLVRLLQPGCRHLFGDSGCKKDLAPLTVTGTIDEADGHRSFTDAARGEAAGYFRRGRVTFTSGMNAGISAEIKEHTAGGKITLWPRLAFPLVSGITYVMTPGCTNLKAADQGTNGCTAWANLVNYGGADKVPGRDKRSSSAIVKGT